MNQLAIWLLIVNSADVALANDLSRFPDLYKANQQIELHREAIDYLHEGERLHGWCNGWWEAQREEIQADKEWWELLFVCKFGPDQRELHGPRFRKITGEFCFRWGISRPMMRKNVP